MKYKLIASMGLLLQLSVYPMLPDQEQLRMFFKIFYPHVKLTSSDASELRQAYNFLKVMKNGLSQDWPTMEEGYAPPLDLMPGLPLQKAVVYVCKQPEDTHALVIRRHTSFLMSRVYNRDLRTENAQYHALQTMNAAILSNVKIISYILTGDKNGELTPDQIKRRKSELIAEVTKFDPTQVKHQER